MTSPEVRNYLKTDVVDRKLCPPYTEAIFKIHSQTEAESFWKIDYKAVLNSVYDDDRRNAVIYLLTKAHKLDLSTATIIHAVTLMDSFLSSCHDFSDDLTLLSMACLLIATKYGDKKMAKADDYKVIKKSKDELLTMETRIIEKLNYNIWPPTVATFLRRFVRALDVASELESELESVSCYLAELSLTSLNFYQYLPSRVAAAITLLAARVIGTNGNHWSDEMSAMTGYKLIDLIPCVHEFVNSNSEIDVAQKYASVSQRFRTVKEEMRYQDIDQIGSCFSKPGNEIDADIKQEMQRKEQEREKSQRIDYVPGETQVLGVTAAQRNPAIPTVPSSGFHSRPLPPRSDRSNKKSKWDKVDGDRRNQDGLSADAAQLSATSVGAGYTAFAQQKGREAEEKRTSDRRRS